MKGFRFVFCFFYEDVMEQDHFGKATAQIPDRREGRQEHNGWVKWKPKLNDFLKNNESEKTATILASMKYKAEISRNSQP